MNKYTFIPGVQQAAALEKIVHWLRHEAPGKLIFRLSGYAGTGKTALAIQAARRAQGRVVFASLTGKAALRMQMAGCSDAMTLHSLLYTPRAVDGGRTRFVLRSNSPLKEAAMLVVDEASMVDDALWADIRSFNVPVLALGDSAQLPPIKGAGLFSVTAPDVMLTEIHRQKENSPVLHLAHLARQGVPLPMGEHGSSRVIDRQSLVDADLLSVDQIIVGMNATRHTFNKVVRELKGFPAALPVVGDKLICEDNNADFGLFNGAMFEVVQLGAVSRAERTIDLTAVSLDFPMDEPVEVTIPLECFSSGFKTVDRRRAGVQWMTYGYAITAHKAQGSEWGSVMVYDESCAFRADAARWLYTAITRAAERVLIVC